MVASVPPLLAARVIGAMPTGQESATDVLPAPSVRPEVAAGVQPPPTLKLTV